MTSNDPSMLRRRRPVCWLLAPAVVGLLAASACTPVFWSFRSGPLPKKEQAAYAAATRELILEDVGIPKGVSVTTTDDHPMTDRDDTVIGVSTRFRLAVPTTTHHVQAWRAAHPAAVLPSAGLDAAFNADVYRPIWDVLEAIAGGLQKRGFERQVDYQTELSLLMKSVGLRRRGVTVWLSAEPPGGTVVVDRR